MNYTEKLTDILKANDIRSVTVLVEKFGLTPIKTAEEDLKAILG